MPRFDAGIEINVVAAPTAQGLVITSNRVKNLHRNGACSPASPRSLESAGHSTQARTSLADCSSCRFQPRSVQKNIRIDKAQNPALRDVSPAIAGAAEVKIPGVVQYLHRNQVLYVQTRAPVVRPLWAAKVNHDHLKGDVALLGKHARQCTS